MTPLEKKQRLMHTHAAHVRWLADNQRPYGSYVPHGQYYYDRYHAGLYEDGSDDDGRPVFSFSIQTSDSPEGDSWWHGHCRFAPGGIDVEILDESWSRN